MNERSAISWQTMLADLSLILFLLTAAALSQAGDGKAHAKPRPAEVSLQAEPLAVYRGGKDAPPLREWLAAQPLDPRQKLTIVSPYRAGGQAEALEVAGRLAREAGEMGRAARIVVEPGEEAAAATLAFDVPQAELARSLRDAGRVQPVSGNLP